MNIKVAAFTVSEKSSNTTDNLVRLETFIRDAFIIKEHVVAVFFFIWKKLMIPHGDTAF